MSEEADGAVDYAEKSILFAAARPDVDAMYSEMAHDELKHAGYLRKIGETMLSENDTSDELMKYWSKAVRHLSEQESTVKMLLHKNGDEAKK